MGNQPTQTLYNEAYGSHDVVQTPGGTIIQKTYLMNTKSDRETFERLLRILKQIQCETTLNFSDVFESGDNIIVQFQHLKTTIKDQIYKKQTQYLNYSEKEVINILDCIISALMLFSFKGLNHHALSTTSVFVRQNPKKYAICYPKLINLTQSPKSISEIHASSEQKIDFLSPEHISKSPLTQKSDIFSLGLLALYLCTQKPIAPIYSSSSINEFQLLKNIDLCSQNYSHDIMSLIREMLEIQPQNRPSLTQTYQKLQLVIENQSLLKSQKSNSKETSERIQQKRQKDLELNGINEMLPTFCYVTDNQFISELYDYPAKQFLGSGGDTKNVKESRRLSNRSGFQSVSISGTPLKLFQSRRI